MAFDPDSAKFPVDLFGEERELALTLTLCSLASQSWVDHILSCHGVCLFVFHSPGPAFQECTGSCHENVPVPKAVSSNLQSTDGLYLSEWR